MPAGRIKEFNTRMSREGKLVKNTFIISIGTFLPKLAAFITLPILTGCLAKEEYGVYELIMDMVSLLLPTATLQIQTAAFRFLIDRRDKTDDVKKIVTNIFVFIVPIALLALTILFFAMFFFLPNEQTGIKLLICLYFFADILVNATRQIARGLNKNLFYSVSAVVSAVCKMLFALLFVQYLQIGLFGAVLSLALASLVSLIVLLITSKIHRYIDLSKVSWGQIKELIGYSWPMVPNSMSMWVMRLSDRFVITGFMGLAPVAVYSAANKLPSMLTLAQTTFTMAWQENASIVSKDKDAGAYYSSMFRTMFDLMAGFMGVLIAATPILFKLLIRGDYSESYPHIPILFLAMFFFSMCAFLGGIYVAYMDTKSVGVTTVVAAICNLVINLAAIKFIGIYAASISTLVSYILLYVYRMFHVRKLVEIRYQPLHILIVIALLVAECTLCFFRNTYLNLLNAAIGVTAFVILNQPLIKTCWKKAAKMLKRA